MQTLPNGVLISPACFSSSKILLNENRARFELTVILHFCHIALKGIYAVYLPGSQLARVEGQAAREGSMWSSDSPAAIPPNAPAHGHAVLDLAMQTGAHLATWDPNSAERLVGDSVEVDWEGKPYLAAITRVYDATGAYSNELHTFHDVTYADGSTGAYLTIAEHGLRLQPPTSRIPPPPPPSVGRSPVPPPQQPVGNGGSPPEVGSEVEVLWADGATYLATVLQKHSERINDAEHTFYKVEFQGGTEVGNYLTVEEHGLKATRTEIVDTAAQVGGGGVSASFPPLVPHTFALAAFVKTPFTPTLTLSVQSTNIRVGKLPAASRAALDVSIIRLAVAWSNKALSLDDVLGVTYSSHEGRFGVRRATIEAEIVFKRSTSGDSITLGAANIEANVPWHHGVDISVGGTALTVLGVYEHHVPGPKVGHLQALLNDGAKSPTSPNAVVVVLGLAVAAASLVALVLAQKASANNSGKTGSSPSASMPSVVGCVSPQKDDAVRHLHI